MAPFQPGGMNVIVNINNIIIAKGEINGTVRDGLPFGDKLDSVGGKAILSARARRVRSIVCRG